MVFPMPEAFVLSIVKTPQQGICWKNYRWLRGILSLQLQEGHRERPHKHIGVKGGGSTSILSSISL